MLDPCCDTVGQTFMKTRLEVECDPPVIARPTLIKQALKDALCIDSHTPSFPTWKELAPEFCQRRAKAAAKTRYQYSVPGPRSMYHMDGHEKLAKLWGIWVHGAVDGYSRKIIYMTVTCA